MTLKITGYGYNLSSFNKRSFFGKDDQGFHRRGSNLGIESALGFVLKPISQDKKQFVIVSNLVKNWKQIVGEKYGEFCYPKAIHTDKSKKITKLTIGVSNSAVGFFLESNSELIIERIARLYGHKAISRITIKQEPKNIDRKQHQEIKVSPEKEKFLVDVISNVEDKDLAATLQRLGREVFGKKLT